MGKRGKGASKFGEENKDLWNGGGEEDQVVGNYTHPWKKKHSLRID